MLKVFRSRNDNVFILGEIQGKSLRFDFAYIATIRDKETVSDGVNNYVLDIPEKARTQTYVVALNNYLDYEIPKQQNC